MDEPTLDRNGTILEAIAAHEQWAQYAKAIARFQAGVNDWHNRPAYALGSAQALGRGLRREISLIVELADG